MAARPWIVLKTSRHHRKNRRPSPPLPFSARSCSTPRGITGKIASSRRGFFSLSNVLNASRHHRKNRADYMAGQFARASAQRLAASPEKSP